MNNRTSTILTALAASTISASASLTWVGGTDSNFFTEANWTDGANPPAADSVNPGSNGISPAQDFVINNGDTVDIDGSFLQITDSGSITVSGSSILNAEGTFGGSLWQGSLSLNDTAQLVRTNTNYLALTVDITLNGASSLNVAGQASSGSALIEVNGTSTFTSAGTGFNSNSVVTLNGGVMDVLNGFESIVNLSGGNLTLRATGGDPLNSNTMNFFTGSDSVLRLDKTNTTRDTLVEIQDFLAARNYNVDGSAYTGAGDGRLAFTDEGSHWAITAVPEPSSTSLLGLAGLGLLLRRRR